MNDTAFTDLDSPLVFDGLLNTTSFALTLYLLQCYLNIPESRERCEMSHSLQSPVSWS